MDEEYFEVLYNVNNYVYKLPKNILKLYYNHKVKTNTLDCGNCKEIAALNEFCHFCDRDIKYGNDNAYRIDKDLINICKRNLTHSKYHGDLAIAGKFNIRYKNHVKINMAYGYETVVIDVPGYIIHRIESINDVENMKGVKGFVLELQNIIKEPEVNYNGVNEICYLK